MSPPKKKSGAATTAGSPSESSVGKWVKWIVGIVGVSGLLMAALTNYQQAAKEFQITALALQGADKSVGFPEDFTKQWVWDRANSISDIQQRTHKEEYSARASLNIELSLFNYYANWQAQVQTQRALEQAVHSDFGKYLTLARAMIVANRTDSKFAIFDSLGALPGLASLPTPNLPSGIHYVVFDQNQKALLQSHSFRELADGKNVDFKALVNRGVIPLDGAVSGQDLQYIEAKTKPRLFQGFKTTSTQ